MMICMLELSFRVQWAADLRMGIERGVCGLGYIALISGGNLWIPIL